MSAGNADEDYYPTPSLSRQPSFASANFRCRTPLVDDDNCSVSGGRPLTLLLQQQQQGCPHQRPTTPTASAANTLNARLTRTCPHVPGGGIAGSGVGYPAGGHGTLTAATSTSTLYDRGGDKLSSTYGRRDDSGIFDQTSLSGLAGRNDCYIHSRPALSSMLHMHHHHNHQCSVHRNYASEDDDEPPEPTYATGKFPIYSTTTVFHSFCFVFPINVTSSSPRYKLTERGFKRGHRD